MKLHSIQLRHCYHFADLKLDFNYHHKPITLILGDQGTGKTAIIKNIYQSLTWFSARAKDLRTAGVVMLDSDIMRSRMQSKIDVQVQFSPDIGLLEESANAQDKDVSMVSWQLYKTLNTSGIGHSKVETQQLEHMVNLYLTAIKQDPMLGLPMIAYYPTDRFVNEMNLLSKNNPAIFQNHSAYELAAIPYTTFSRFFEWFREVCDIENSQTAHLFQHILDNHQDHDSNQPPTTEVLNPEQEPPKFDLSQAIFQSRSQLHSPCLLALKSTLNKVFPELTDIYLEYLPKLQLLVNYQQQTIPFTQLNSTLRNWIALVGDVVRRLCLLNPNSLYPCLEGEGILLIDNVDAHLDALNTQNILERLNQAFPHVQIIVTGSNDDLLEYAEHYQCLRLANKSIQEIKLNESGLKFNEIYQELVQSQQNNYLEPLEADEPIATSVQELFEQYQDLNDEQQIELMKLIIGDDNIPSEKIQ